jgi:hypothetical protein
MTLKNQTIQTSIILILLFFTFQSFGYEKELLTEVPKPSLIIEVEKNDNFDSVFLNLFINANKLTAEKLATHNAELSHLQHNLNEHIKKNEYLTNQLLSLQKQLYQIEAKINVSDNDSSNAGVLLTAVAVIVTTLGVIIAVITFIGYKDIVQRAEDKAREITVSLINKTANDEMTRLIDSGAFETHITQAVDRVVYKDLYADDELTNDNDSSVNKEG